MLAAALASFGLSTSVRTKTTTRRNFLWDQGILYVGLSLVVITLFAIAEAFFGQGYDLACLIPSSFSRDQAAFVNRFCSERIKGMKLMPLAFVVQLVVVIGPHQMWKAYAGPKLKQFFSMTLSIARYRDRKTGLFSSVTIETVKRLRDDFGRQDDVVKSYERKLTLQLIFAAASAAGISAASLLLQPGKAFDTTFICRLESSDYGKYWLERQRQYCLNSSCFSLNQTAVPCTYSFPVVLLPLWVSNLVLLAVIAALALWGMIWRRSSHWEMLDFEGKADFFYALCVNTAKYEPSDSWKKQCTIKTNLDLFLSMLYATDKGHGETFHDVLVSLSLDERWKRDRALHASVKLVEQAKRSALHEFLRKKVIDRLKRLEKPKFSLGLHIYSGSNGAAIHLVNHFENVS